MNAIMARLSPPTMTTDAGRAAHGYRRTRRRRSGATLTLNMVPMIDIVFNLLIFFLVATKFTAAEGVLPGRVPRLAPAQATPAVPVPPIRVFLAVRPGGGCAIRVESMPAASFDELAERLGAIRGELGADAGTSVILMADDALAWDHLANAYNAAMRAGFESIVFGEP